MREAQAQGRAFVYTYRELISPDIDLIVQALFGVRGERLLLKAGRLPRKTSIDRSLRAAEVLPDGNCMAMGCTSAHSSSSSAHSETEAHARARHDAARLVAHEFLVLLVGEIVDGEIGLEPRR